MTKSITVFAAFALVLSLYASSAHAHGVWIAKRCDKHCIVYGEGAKDNAYPPAKVKEVRAFTADRSSATVETISRDDHVELNIADDAAVVAIFFDNGYWSKDENGKSVNKPMTEVPGSSSGNLTLKYNTTYLDSKVEPRAIDNLEMQIVPSVNPAGLSKGDMLEVTVLRNGQPVAEAPVIIDVVNDPENTVVTDANGKVSFPIRNDGLNVIGVEIDFPLEKDEKATGVAYFASLSFLSK